MTPMLGRLNPNMHFIITIPQLKQLIAYLIHPHI
nr:MAG TPA: hypothetical protein [Caudoviricetes sp.]